MPASPTAKMAVLRRKHFRPMKRLLNWEGNALARVALA